MKANKKRDIDMDFVKIKDLYRNISEYEGKSVDIAGWVRTIRASNAFGFIEVNDGSTILSLQVVLDAKHLENYTSAVKTNVGAAVIIKGVIVLTPEAKQPLELHAEVFTLEGGSSPDKS